MSPIARRDCLADLSIIRCLITFFATLTRYGTLSTGSNNEAFFAECP